MNAMKRTAAVLALLGGFLVSGMAFAAGDTPHKIVIQVNSADEATQNLALNNAVNLQKEYGIDGVTVEVVAYGPGLSLLTRNGGEASKRVESLAMQDIAFSACGNTMANIEKKTGKKPELLEGVGVVPAGVGRIMELQEQGYAYLRP